MKKLLILILSISLIAGCQQPTPPPLRQEDDRRLAATSWWREDFDGHTYIIRSGSDHGWGSGITHDPDCKCYSKIEQQEKNVVQ